MDSPTNVDKRAALDTAMRRLYAAISFPEGGTPDWAGVRALFAPWARVTRVTPEGVDALDLAGFEAMFTELLESGAVLSFYEYEVARRLDLFGSVAHVLSAYETKRSLEALAPFGRGINSVQLLFQDGRWSIVSLVWDEGLPHQIHGFDAAEVIHDSSS